MPIYSIFVSIEIEDKFVQFAKESSSSFMIESGIVNDVRLSFSSIIRPLFPLFVIVFSLGQDSKTDSPILLTSLVMFTVVRFAQL